MKKDSTIKILFLISILSLFIINSYSRVINTDNFQKKNNISIVTQNYTSITFEISVNNFTANDICENGQLYQIVRLDNYGFITDVGVPGLPYRGLSLITSEKPNLTIEIISQETVILKNYMVYPAIKQPFAVAGMKSIKEFQINKELYSQNQFYPSLPVRFIRNVDYRGVPVSIAGITPILFNPVTEELKVYKKLKVKISWSSPVRSDKKEINEYTRQLIKNIAVNGEYASQYLCSRKHDPTEDFNKDILILTVPSYRSAAERLAEWHKKKGYDVEVMAQAWTTSTIETTVKNFYNSTNPKPGYLVIIGDQKDVPAKVISDEGNIFPTDLYYTTMGDTSDYIADMARGRISVGNGTQAEDFVAKVIGYEQKKYIQNADSNFFKKTVVSGYFEDENSDGTCDYRFIQTCEEARSYLLNQKYACPRLYSTQNIRCLLR